MITISDPIINKISEVAYSVAITVTNTDDITQAILGTKGININVGKDEDAVAQLQPFIDQATDELLKEHDELAQFSAQFEGFKDTANVAIATKISNINKGVVA